MKSQKKFQIVIFWVKKYFYLSFLNLVRQSILFLRAIQKRSMAWICRIMELFYTFSKRLKSLFFPFFQKGRMEQLLDPRISLNLILILFLICQFYAFYRDLCEYMELRDRMLDVSIRWKRDMRKRDLEDFVGWQKFRFINFIILSLKGILRTDLSSQMRKILLDLGVPESPEFRGIWAFVFIFPISGIAFFYLLDKIIFILIFFLAEFLYILFSLLEELISLLDWLGLLDELLDFLEKIDFFR